MPGRRCPRPGQPEHWRTDGRIAAGGTLSRTQKQRALPIARSGVSATSASIRSLLAQRFADRLGVRFDDLGVRLPDTRLAAIWSKHRTLLSNCLGTVVAEVLHTSTCTQALARKQLQERGQLKILSRR